MPRCTEMCENVVLFPNQFNKLLVIQMVNIFSSCHMTWKTVKNVVPRNSSSNLDQVASTEMCIIQMKNICSACHMTGIS